MTDTKFRADQGGSLLRPEPLLAARRRREAGEIDGAQLRAAEDAAIADAATRQAEAGIDVLTDGEFRRRDFRTGFVGAVDGFPMSTWDMPWRSGDGVTKVPSNTWVATGRLRPRGRLAGDEAAHLLGLTAAPVKVTLIAPGFLEDRFWKDGVATDQFYTSRDEFAAEVAAITRAEVEALIADVSVVLADADLDVAAATVASAAFAQAGQRCTATSRLIVDASVAPALTERLRGRVAEIVLGPGLDPATTVGPLSYAAHRDGVLEHIERARKEEAEVIVGGVRPASDALAYGCYVQPTLINVTPAQPLGRDAVFGPVLAITTATGFDDAVRLANDTAFGLAAAVFTGSPTAATLFLDEAEAGQGAPGLRFYTGIKTTAVRYQW